MENQTTTRPFLKAIAFAFVFTIITSSLMFMNIERELPPEASGEIFGYILGIFLMAAIINGFIIRKSPKVWSLPKIGITTFLLSILTGVFAGMGTTGDSEKKIAEFKRGVQKGMERAIEGLPQYDAPTKVMLKRYSRIKIEQHFDALNIIMKDSQKEASRFGDQFFAVIYAEMSTEEKEEFQQIEQQAFSGLSQKDLEEYAHLTENIQNVNQQQIEQIKPYVKKAHSTLPKKDRQRYNEIMKSIITRLLNKISHSK